MPELYSTCNQNMTAVCDPEAPSITKITAVQKDQARKCLELTWKLLEHVRGPAPIGNKEERNVKCLLDDLYEQTEMLAAVAANLNELCSFIL